MRQTLTRLAIAALALAACAHAGDAGALTVSVGTPKAVGLGMASIPITATNTGRRPNERMAVTCTFFDAAGQAIVVSRAYFRGVAPGGSENGGFLLHSDPAAIASHDCKVAPPH